MAYNRRIKDLPESSRPREKLEYKGAQNLSDAELLAIILGTGTKKQNAVILAKKILNSFPLSKLTAISINQLLVIPGIGKTKASRIIACLELGHRIFTVPALNTTLINSTAEAIVQAKEISSKKQEHLLVLYLNARHQLIGKEIIAIGNLNALMIEPKEVFLPALTTPCCEIIICHNHPSDNPTPSKDDILFTQTIQKAGIIMGIGLIDHLIVCRSGYFSFREQKLL